MTSYKTILSILAISLSCFVSSYTIASPTHRLDDNGIASIFNLPVPQHTSIYHTSKGVVDIYLSDSIDDSFSVRDVVHTLDLAKDGDKINFHLIGTGGNAETLWYLIDHVKCSKAYVTMIVEGPCYSAHAYLATSGNALVMEPLTFLMFHTSSIYGMDTRKATGTDRTVPNSEHLKRMYDMEMYITNKMIIDNPWLTDTEKLNIMTGHSIYISVDDIAKRPTPVGKTFIYQDSYGN